MLRLKAGDEAVLFNGDGSDYRVQLLRVAREGKIFIGLDVYHEEPLPVDSGLRGLANVSLTPHIAGPTPDRHSDATAFALRNLRAYAAGQPLEAIITPAIYDSST